MATALFLCDAFAGAGLSPEEQEGGDSYGADFGYADDDIVRKQEAGAICAIQACAGERVVANTCEEYSGDTLFRLFDSEWRLVAENDDALGDHVSYDDDENDNAASHAYYDDHYSYGSSEVPKCSKIAYTVPVGNASSSNASSTSVCSTYYLQQTCRGFESCSGRTRVAGGIAAPSSEPSGVPSAAPSAAADWKESVFVFSFRAKVDILFKCDNSRCSDMAELDAPAQEAFREMFASSMTGAALEDVSQVSVSVASSYWPRMRGIFSIQVISANSSSMPAAIAQLSSEIEGSFSSQADTLSALFLSRSYALGSQVVTENRSITVSFYNLLVSAEFRVEEEVQTFVPSAVPSGSPTVDPTRCTFVKTATVCWIASDLNFMYFVIFVFFVNVHQYSSLFR